MLPNRLIGARRGNRTPRGTRLLLLASAVLVAGSACEPAAFVVPQVLKFQAVHSPGAVGSECGAESWDRVPVVRMTLVDTDGAAIWPGSRLGSRYTLELNSNFSIEDIAVSGNRGRIFPSPDVLCDEGSLGDACPVAELAQAGFVCLPLDLARANDPQARIGCVRDDFPVSVSPNATLEFTGEGSQRKAVIALISNGASALGQTSSRDINRTGCSTDPFDRRTRGLNLMVGQLAASANPVASNTTMCVGTFTGTSEPNYRAPEGQTVANCFQRMNDAGTRFLEDTSSEIGNNEDLGAGRNPWAAIRDAAGRFDEWADPAAERHIVVFTDGDISEDARQLAEAQGLVFDVALEAALEHDVKVHIVQLDRADRGSDCFPATVHGASDEMARMACQTGGNYRFVTRAEDVPEFFENVGRSIPGRYEVPLLADNLAILPLGPYSLELVMEVRVDGDSRQYTFSAEAGTGGASRVDTRLNLFNRGDCSSGRDCYSGYVCADSDVCLPPIVSEEAEGPAVPPGDDETPEEGEPEGEGDEESEDEDDDNGDDA